MQRVHFIAIGGSAMHNLALALKAKGLDVSGSDDEIFEPSKSRLEKAGILPEAMGWFPEKIEQHLDAIILGMHARTDNPELLKAQALGLKIYSYPEFVYEQSRQKHRIVIAGSHGKTTITSMILHVLKTCQKSFDYLVGAQIEGFERMVQLSGAPTIVIEGDEYLASPIHRESKFMLYKHHILVISGIAWDHINVFPTFDLYKEQFNKLIQSTPKAGVLIYNEDDKSLQALVKPLKREDIYKIPYSIHKHKIKEGITYLSTEDEKVALQIFGDHNLSNLSAAKEVCHKLGIKDSEFYKAIASFKGASNRLELLAENKETKVFKDFAHAPSKLKATTKAMANQFSKRKLIACLELHTFSSLNKNFLGEYKDTFNDPDVAIVYYNPHTIEHKKLEAIGIDEIKKAFNNSKLIVFDDSADLQSFLLKQNYKSTNLLLMSSGNFDGISLKDFAQKIVHL